MTAPSTGTAVAQPRLLQAAQAGDQDAFGRLVEPHQGELLAHCYRMLGSLRDAEDAMQDASLRAWRALARFEGRSSLRSWLYTIATNTALQHLPANQRAALILREVLGFSAREVAEALETTVASVNSALQRARATLDDELPQRSQQATLRDLGDEALRELVEGYMEAMGGGDVDPSRSTCSPSRATGSRRSQRSSRARRSSATARPSCATPTSRSTPPGSPRCLSGRGCQGGSTDA